MELLTKYLTKIDFENYDDFKKNYKVVVPANFDFARDVVDEWARLEPNKLALVYCNDKKEEKTFTFTDISVLSKKIATYLLRLGIKKGDKVIAILRRRYEFWLLSVALHRIGAVLVPVSTQMTQNDLIYRINASSAKLIVAVDDKFVLEQLRGIKDACSSLDKICIVGKNIGEYEDFNEGYLNSLPCEQTFDNKNNDDMLIYFTSGTTSHPKLTVHNRLYPLGHIITAKYLHQVQNNGLHITQADSGWAKFGWGNMYGQWICGTAILCHDTIHFDSQEFLEVLRKYRPTTVCLPPTMYRILIRDGIRREDIEQVANFTSAGEPMTKELNQTFKRISGKYIREGFGQSEGTPLFANWKYIDVKLGSMGKPTPQSEIRIMNKKGEVCETGDSGEIIVLEKLGGIGLMKGYIYDKKFFSPYHKGKYHTGDIAYIDKDGYGHFEGRNDEVIKSSGYRVSPYELEDVLNMHPAINESAVIGVPDKIREKIVCAIVCLNDGYTPSEELTKEIQTFVKTNTAPYKYPRKIIYIDKLPRTTSGKIERKTIKARYGEGNN